jgi:hypothetical protein
MGQLEDYLEVTAVGECFLVWMAMRIEEFLLLEGH